MTNDRGWHLAQINIARMRHDLDDPRMAGFVDNLDKINALGEEAPGFLWRYQDDSGAATDTRGFDDDDLLLNITVWESIDALRDYVVNTEHVNFLRRKLEWFDRVGELPTNTLWWIPAGSVPTVAEAVERVHHLHGRGPTEHAFTFKDRFDPPASGR